MAFFLVTMTHPDGEGWGRHVVSHVDYLKSLIAVGKIRASGPVEGLGKRAGFILVTADDREEVEQLIALDPFAVEGLIDELTILSWDPMFGAFADDPARGKTR
ncbi:YciI family protein [Phenylobacterium sp.]|uniref:YciI family protein n=1 Tax=Phenylobacterium sp. TaxID=1871053 RepID=UPI002897F4BB|nr:YciI family protein [Phenylobacterium sp.]